MPTLASAQHPPRFAITDLFPRFATAIRTVNLAVIDRHTLIPAAFLLERDGPYAVNYIPFEAVNRAARVVVVGLTPGFLQWRNGVAEAQRQLLAGATQEEALLAPKRFGAFSGPLRPNLIALLDAIGLHEWLGIPSCAVLFDTRPDLLHTTWLLRHPVSRHGVNYSGTPAPVAQPFLRRLIGRYFAHEAAALGHAIFVSLGPAVADGLRWLADQGARSQQQIFDGLPHPSGANGERIAYLLGRKDRGTLSSRTDPARLTLPVRSSSARLACCARDRPAYCAALRHLVTACRRRTSHTSAARGQS